MMLGVQFCGFGGVVCRVVVMSLGSVCVVASSFVIASVMVLRGFAMMAGCVFVMLGRLSVMLCSSL